MTTDDAERLRSPISQAELDRRWAAARAVMRERDVDVLVLQNSNDFLGGYIRWFTGAPANNAYPRAALFYADRGMTIIEQGPFEGVKYPDNSPFFPGVERILTTPSYVSVAYTAEYDAQLAADAIKERGGKTVGWVNPAAAYFGFGKGLEKLLPNARFVDVTNDIDDLKAIKSAEEQALIRRTTALQDDVMSAVTGFIKEGMYDYEVAAFAKYTADQLGAEQGIFISSSAPVNRAAVFRPPHEWGRRIGSGDVFTLLVETNGPGGFYTEIGRAFTLGKPSQALTEGVALAIEAQAATLRNLTPGASCRAIADKHDEFMTARGFPKEKRLYAHGQGYDMVERPLVRQDETMSIAEGMSMVCHPGYINDEVFATICDNYLIGPEGPGACLHKTEKTIFQI